MLCGNECHDFVIDSKRWLLITLIFWEHTVGLLQFWEEFFSSSFGIY